MSASKDVYFEQEKSLRRIQVFTNEFSNLMFWRTQNRYLNSKREIQISGMLFRTYSEIDLLQLDYTMKQIDSR